MAPPATAPPRELADLAQVLIRLLEQFERSSADRLAQHERFCEERQAAFHKAMEANASAMETLVGRIETIDQRRREGVQGLHRRVDGIEAKSESWRAGAMGRVLSWQNGLLGLALAVIGYLLAFGRPWVPPS